MPFYDDEVVNSFDQRVTHFSRLSPKVDALLISPSNTVNSWAVYLEVDGPVIGKVGSPGRDSYY